MEYAGSSANRIRHSSFAVPLVLAALTLFFFADLAFHPTHILYSNTSDFVALHVPARSFLVRSWQETGELPLWDPHTFAGSPFVHDMQLAILYPPHLLLYFVSAEHVGSALSWLAVLHVWLAGLTMYFYARQQHLDRLSGLVSACGFMFAGKWLIHLLAGGHYLVIGLAWLPLVLLCLERALQHGGWLWATWAGVLFALVVLSTQPQWTLYAGLFVAVWTLGEVLFPSEFVNNRRASSRKADVNESRKADGNESRKADGKDEWTRAKIPARPSGFHRFLRWLGFGLWSAFIAAALSAVQILPALEAAAQSTRAAGIAPGQTSDGWWRPLLFFVGPPLGPQPIGFWWEEHGGFTFLWIAVAIMSLKLSDGKTRFRFLITTVLVVFALGGGLLLQNVPGFRLFRHPARMLLIATLPIALLAGISVQRAFQASAESFRRCRSLIVPALCVCAVLVGGGLALYMRIGRPLSLHPYWISLLVTIPTFAWLLGTNNPLHTNSRRSLLYGLLLIDLLVLSWPLVTARDEGEVYSASSGVRFLQKHKTDRFRVLDRDTRNSLQSSPLGSGAPLARICGIASLRGFNPVDVLRYKEYLQFIEDQDKPLRAFDGPLTQPLLGKFEIKNRNLVDLLGVRWLYQPEKMPLPGGGWQKLHVYDKPHAYDIHAGKVWLPRYAVYENDQVLPRAFVVPLAKELPPRSKVLPALRDSDFRTVVFLENRQSPGSPLPIDDNVRPVHIRQMVRNRTVVMQKYTPNEVIVTVEPGPPGYLVLTDIWYPGWSCRVNRKPQTLYRANYLFRAVAIGDGAQEVIFRFAPKSYARGLLISAIGVIGVVLVHVFWLILRPMFRAKRSNPDATTPL